MVGLPRMAPGNRIALSWEASVKRVVVSVAVVICTVVFGAASAGATASGTWRSQHVPRPPGHIGYLNSVSCWSAGSCIAVGTSFNNGVQYTMAEHWDRSGWTLQSTPSLGGPVATLTSVSCTSATNCMAIGGYTGAGTSGPHSLAEHWNGAAWAVQSIPEPAGGTELGLDSVSCGSPTSCTAVGAYASSGSPVLVAAHWDGTNWTLQRMPFVRFALGAPSSVSCPTARSCVAVGSYNDSKLFAERWNGSRWAFQEIPTPAGQYFQLNSVSCAQPQNCLAVGGAFNGPQPVGSIVARATATGWVLEKDAAPAQTVLLGVSCASDRSCTAVGENAADPVLFHTGVAESWNGTSWAMQALPVPQPDTRGASLSGASCATATACTAVGVYGHPGDRPLADRKG
jgi:hypothetical protein